MICRQITAGLISSNPITSYKLGQSATVFDPRMLFANGETGFFHSAYALSSMFTDAAGTIPVTAVDDYVGKRNDLTANAIAFTQSTSTARPQYKGTYLKYDLTDDAMSATMPAIASGTVVILTSKGAWFDTFTSASGAFAWGPTTYTGGPTGLFTALRQDANDYREIARLVINRALTAAEKAQILAWAKPRGCPGEITLSSERVTNGTFDSGTSGWTADLDTSLSVVSGRLRVALASGINPSFTQGVTITRMKFAILSMDSFGGTTGGSVISRAGNTAFSSEILNSSYTAVTGKRFVIQNPSSTNDTVFITGLNLTSTVGQYGEWDNISVKELVFP